MDFIEYIIKKELRERPTWYVEKWEGKYLLGNKSERIRVGAAILAPDGKSYEWSSCGAMGFPTYDEAVDALTTLP